jgi:hypothetical protein
VEEKLMGGRMAALALSAVVAGTAACATNGKVSSASSISAADYALRKAGEEELDERSKVTLRKAQDKLERARKLRDEGEHEEAERLADEAALEAQLADAMAQNTRVHRVVDEIERSIETLRSEAQRGMTR